MAQLRPLTAAGLRGRVVLVDFWTYTCVNWLRTLPYLRAWAAKYGDARIDHHRRPYARVRDRARRRERSSRQRARLLIEYPIAIDNDYAIWEAFDNHYWPALYFVDARGPDSASRLRRGRVRTPERVLQQLLVDAGSSSAGSSAGFRRRSRHRSRGGLAALSSRRRPTSAIARALRVARWCRGYDERRVYRVPERLRLNEWALVG